MSSYGTHVGAQVPPLVAVQKPPSAARQRSDWHWVLSVAAVPTAAFDLQTLPPSGPLAQSPSSVWVEQIALVTQADLPPENVPAAHAPRSRWPLFIASGLVVVLLVTLAFVLTRPPPQSPLAVPLKVDPVPPPEPVKGVEPVKPPPPKPRPIPVVAPARSAPAKPTAAKPDLNLDALEASLAKSPRSAPPRPAFARRGPSRAETAPRPRVDAGQGVSQSDKAGLSELLNRLWNPNCSVEGGDAVTVPVTFTVGEDGRVVGRVSAGGREAASDPVVFAAARRAIDAVHQAEPYAAVYRHNAFRVNFDAKTACSNR